ncbi:MAG: phage portal protein [Campylobacteraceae bacterium]|jgi:lambda family phage portal protein|nr:phage portal protein [Campylobacteraceae bacterium]
MKFFGLNITRTKPPKPQTKYIALRNYDAAKNSDLLFNYNGGNSSADALLSGNLSKIRNRSRDLARNNEYVKKFKRMVSSNIIGPNGIALQNKAKNKNGGQDKKTNDIIETAWWKWGEKGNCDVTGKYSFRALCSAIAANVCIDGEVLVRKIKTSDGLKLQLIEADHLPEHFNDTHKNIKMGIEFDAYGKPIAYHIAKFHPSDLISTAQNEYVRIPSDEIIHVFLPDRISQTRGVPWVHAAVTKLKMINGYEEAELVAARLSAAKGGFYISPAAEDYIGDDTADNGDPIQEVTPGMLEKLPAGWDFKPFDPNHPTTAFAEFEKAVLRGIASGLDVSYAYLTNDLESYNFSSIRAGVLDEREAWMNLQSWFIEEFLNDVYKEWLKMALLTKAVPFALNRFDDLCAPFWMPRRWAWVDPQKDITANILALKAGLKAPSQVASEMGYDLEEVYEAIKRDQDMRESMGIQTASDAELLLLLANINKGDGKNG